MKIAHLFPGQGSQSVGMMADLAASYPEVKSSFELGSDLLKVDLWKLVSDGPEEKLNQTENTQPIMLCASMAIAAIWNQKSNDVAAISAGHSFGEYSALVNAEVFNFETALPIAKYRGQVMQEAVPKGVGAMAAILGLDDEELQEVCKQSSQEQVVQAVNFNAPGQTVIAGNSEAVVRAIELAKSEGAKRAVQLPLSVPSHSNLMQPAAEKLKEYLQDVPMQTPRLDVVNNVDVQVNSHEKDIKDALYRQLFNPVRWVDTIQLMISQGVEVFFELGPGKVLTGLCKRIDKKVPCYGVFDCKSLELALEKVNNNE